LSLAKKSSPPNRACVAGLQNRLVIRRLQLMKPPSLRLFQRIKSAPLGFKDPLHNPTANPKHFARWEYRAAPA
jgi:hypothetical protein